MDWNLKKNKDPQWPNGEDGEPISPVFLIRIHGGPLDMEITLNLLKAYDIPYVCQYPNNGLFGKLILGYPPGGMEVFVPETLLEDAQNVLNADSYVNEEDGESGEIDGSLVTEDEQEDESRDRS